MMIRKVLGLLTSNGNNGTKTPANEPIEATGEIYKGQSFDGLNDLISKTSATTLDLQSPITVTAPLGEITTTYNNQYSPSTFNSVSSEEMWEQGIAEPVSCMLSGNGDPTGLSNGSVVLGAYQASVSFGNATMTGVTL